LEEGQAKQITQKIDPTWDFNIANKFMKINKHKLAMPGSIALM